MGENYLDILKDYGGVYLSTNPYAARTIRVKIADPLGVKKVIFNPPATIVYWGDGEKTVVHCCEDDTYNREMGLALCIAKKALKNSSRKLNDILSLAEEKEEKKEVK